MSEVKECVEEKENKIGVKKEVESGDKTSYNGAELLEMGINEIPTLIEPIIPKVGLMSVIGTSDIGKSTLLLQLCRDVVLNEKFLGYPIHAKHKSAIYVSTEDDRYAISKRLQPLKGSCDMEKLKNLRFLFNSDNLLQKLEKKLIRQKADVIVIDTFSDVYTGEMNQINKVRSYMNEFQNLAITHQCLVIFNHHTGKYAEEKAPDKSNSVGSAGFEGKCRLVIELRKDYNDESKRHLCIVKGNYLGAEYKTKSYELEFDQVKGYTPTGRREDFNNLVKLKSINLSVNRSKQKELAIKLKMQGLSCRKIAEALEKEGFNVSKSTIADWTKDVSEKKDETSPDEVSSQETPNGVLDTGQLALCDTPLPEQEEGDEDQLSNEEAA